MKPVDTCFAGPAGPFPIHRIAVVGSGISGLAAAWLLAQHHAVTLFEADQRPGGHSNTVEVADGHGGTVAVDTGFIVCNPESYPNLIALLAHLDVPTVATDMSFAVSLDQGRLEYSGTSLNGLFAQRRNLASPRFWGMLRDLVRFYRRAPADARDCGLMPLAEFLDRHGYGAAFRQDHLYPMAAAIWSTPAAEIGRYPVEALVRFCANHRLLSLGQRPAWLTVAGGSRRYVDRMLAALPGQVRLGCPVRRIERQPDRVLLHCADGAPAQAFDEVVLATHADRALELLEQPSDRERQLLGSFSYTHNRAVLHTDATCMPRRRSVWSSWNYLADGARRDALSVTYWMNQLQQLGRAQPLFVTLNPLREPAPGSVLYETGYRHPLFDASALRAQQELWSLQGCQRSWFCGAWFGAGFHEDGLQAGLAVAEAIGGVRRPWTVANESGRIHLLPRQPVSA